ncbi:MazF family transcriptional regulator [Macromonas bipunctata]|uniref:MazF family transcriptional regulator n=1 Tax=Macromonas bipunctata TaxID=183670 RepID=UPI000C338598|nr:MazF family transcriptional regulator [Macromonas bipunctata]
MGPFATRQVILLPFPFSDLSASKLRPALLLANAGKGDWVLCQITSKPYADARAITLTEADFVQGGLRLTSYARAGKLFTAHESPFQRVAGTLQAAAHQHVVEQVVALLCEETPGTEAGRAG